MKLKIYLKRICAFLLSIILIFLSVDNLALAIGGIFSRDIELSYLYKNGENSYFSQIIDYSNNENIKLEKNPDFLNLNDGESVIAYKLVLLNRSQSELEDYISNGNIVEEKDFSEYIKATPSDATPSDAEKATPSEAEEVSPSEAMPSEAEEATPSEATPSEAEKATPSEATPSEAEKATPSNSKSNNEKFIIYNLDDEYVYASGEYSFEYFKEIFNREEFKKVRNLNFAFVPIIYSKMNVEIVEQNENFISYRISNAKDFILEYYYTNTAELIKEENENSYLIKLYKTYDQEKLYLNYKYNENILIDKEEIDILPKAMPYEPEIENNTPTETKPENKKEEKPVEKDKKDNSLNNGSSSNSLDNSINNKFQFELKGYSSNWSRFAPKWEFKNIANKLVYYKLWNTSLGQKESSTNPILYKGEDMPIDLDGIYMLKVWWEDDKGNKFDELTREIKIDRFMPEIELFYNSEKISESKYYNKEVVADIKIIEGNFDASKVNIIVNDITRKRKFKPEYNFTSRNGVNSTKVYFKESGRYSINVDVVDLADRQAKSYVGEIFVVDFDSPKLKILGVDNLSSNKIIPEIKIFYSDENIDRAKTNVALKSMSSKKRYELKSKSETALGSYRIDDVGKLEDDTYLLEANIYDLAGNNTSKSIVFSINTKGATFLFKPTELIGEYTNKNFVPKIEIWNTEEVNIISATINGVEEEYTYINGELAFNNEISKEGKYIFNLEVLDTAGNKSNMPTVELVLDKTPPNIVIDGLEKNGTYKEKLEFIVSTLNKQDSIKSIFLNGNEFKDYKTMEDGSKKIILNNNGAYNLHLEAVDKAGNTSIEKVNFTIESLKVNNQTNPNKSINKFLFIPIITFATVLSGFIAYLLMKRRR